MSTHQKEVKSGERFEFGDNWLKFLETLNPERIHRASRSFKERLGEHSICGESFLDVGSGSGLFSLAAAELGAKKIHSIDYDPRSVACTQTLKKRYYPNHAHWIIEQGSALDRQGLMRLGTFDVVYAWGVLHHTGDMWRALENMLPLVKTDGKLFISIYNDQGFQSKFWRFVKQMYCLGRGGRWFVTLVFFPVFFFGLLSVDLLSSRNPFKRYRDYYQNRGMSIVHDWIDWLGGYPFEVAKPLDIVQFYEKRGMKLVTLHTVGRKIGCNEFVFVKH